MKIYDCFYFFNELDLLDIRLNILDSCVDKFVLVESNQTFNGKDKPLHYDINKNKFDKWNDKIIHYVIDDYPNDKEIYEKALQSPNTGNKEHWWVREFYQKESLLKALKDADDNDLIFVSDVDEIWNPKINFSFIKDENVYKPVQTARPFYLNYKSNQPTSYWTGTRVGLMKTLRKYGPNHFRTEREVESKAIQDGGWHFSWLSKNQNKWNDLHPDNNNRFNAVCAYSYWKDEIDLPDYLKNNKEKYKHLFI
jgi:beta-1,4-mannosyl-glycoprotein beta-1,4-N-acetylglucosaminyltransferase